MKQGLFYTLLFILFLGFTNLHSQKTKEKVTRILFVLDASGSMSSKWKNEEKFEVARDLLFKAVDSLSLVKEDIEFALRVFGHQSDRNLNDCKDSKLEVSFAEKNAQQIRDKLKEIKIQGQTPIAYSLFQAVNDFPFDPFAKNVIVLITDGIETCEGDPCSVTGILKSKNIALRPFIIGLGLNEDEKQQFDCVGTYYDAQNKSTFKKALDVVISQAMNSTTVQVNLLDISGKATETNVELTFYDAFSGQIEHMYVHAKDYYERVDTLYMSPVINYDLTVHTVPPVTKKNIELSPGIHNIIAVDVPQGFLTLKIEGFQRYSELKSVIRKAGQKSIIDVQVLNSRKKLIVGKYDLEVLTLPRLYFKNVEIRQSGDHEISIPDLGKMNLLVGRPGLASIYTVRDGKMEMVYEDKNLSKQLKLDLLPGEYIAIFRQNLYKSSELTMTKYFSIESRKTTNVQF
jgi:Ca-activated chloride channel homolog